MRTSVKAPARAAISANVASPRRAPSTSRVQNFPASRTAPTASSRSAWSTAPSRVTELGAVLQALREEAVGAVLLAGKFWTRDVLGARRGDATFAEMAARAGALTDVRILDVIVQTLADLRITLLDQREFLGDDLAAAGCWSARTPTEEERRDVERGLGLARQAAEARIGQTVVLRRGAIAAV